MPNYYHINGPCDIYLGAVNLGTSKAGVTIRPHVTWNPVVVDQLGAAPAGYIYAGQSCVVEALLTETEIGARGFTEMLDAWFPGGLAGTLIGTPEIPGSDPCLVGETALTAQGSGICEELTIKERVSTELWVASQAFVVDPAEVLLAATAEQNIPISFIIIPADDVLFSTLPSYL